MVRSFAASRGVGASRGPRMGFVLLAAIAAALGPLPSTADPYVGKTFRVTGPNRDGSVRMERIQWRDTEADPHRGQVVGRVVFHDESGSALRVGPLEVTWEPGTEWRGVTSGSLRPGDLVKVTGRAIEPGRLLARVIEPGPEGPWPAAAVQLTGTVADTRPGTDGALRAMILGVPVDLVRAGYNRAESLTRRQDSRRPEHPFTVSVAGRPLRITGEVDTTLRDRRNHRLDDRANPNIRDDAAVEAQLEFLLTLSDHLYVFVEGKAAYEDEYRRTSGAASTVSRVDRGVSWVFLDGLAGNRIGLQLGRQNVREFREWWWDADLDAARVYFDEGPIHAEAGLARQLARVSSREPSLDAAARGLTRAFATVSWLWASRQTLDVFALRQQDGSEADPVGDTIAPAHRDASDANLTWLGLRAIGQRGLGDAGTLRYWADAAWVQGSERFTSYSSAGLVRSVSDRSVRGYAIDAGASWQLPLPGEPAITVGFARGSGDANTGDGVDGNFRQTGLHKNKARFFGVNRFRIYGELLRPELSNLNVSTLALGAPLPGLRNSSIELVHHRYWQSEAARSLRDVRIDAALDGVHRHVGDEIDLVLGFRDARQLDVILTAGLFRAGAAYGPLQGKTARLLMAEVVLFF